MKANKNTNFKQHKLAPQAWWLNHEEVIMVTFQIRCPAGHLSAHRHWSLKAQSPAAAQCDPSLLGSQSGNIWPLFKDRRSSEILPYRKSTFTPLKLLSSCRRLTYVCCCWSSPCLSSWFPSSRGCSCSSQHSLLSGFRSAPSTPATRRTNMLASVCRAQHTHHHHHHWQQWSGTVAKKKSHSGLWTLGVYKKIYIYCIYKGNYYLVQIVAFIFFFLFFLDSKTHIVLKI